MHRIVTESMAAGATLLAGGTHEGRFYRPTVLSNMGVNMPAFAEEIFGPVAPITVFDTDEEAIALAKGSTYGLAAAIHSRSTARAMRMDAAASVGIPTFDDQNGVLMEGVGGAALANLRIRDRRRRKLPSDCLYPVLRRPNITLLTGAEVQSLTWKGQRVILIAQR